jgi:hypothetical protein
MRWGKTQVKSLSLDVAWSVIKGADSASFKMTVHFFTQYALGYFDGDASAVLLFMAADFFKKVELPSSYLVAQGSTAKQCRNNR